MVGYSRNGITIGIGKMIGLKKPCLYIVEGNCFIKYASFNNEECARAFIDILEEFIGIKKINREEYDDEPNTGSQQSVEE